jgi:hypothetical protein
MLTREIYGRSFDEILAMAFERGCRKGYAEGHELGCAEGVKDGIRKAKGRKKSTRTTAEQLIPFLLMRIDWQANGKQAVRASIELLRTMAVGHHVVRKLHNARDQDLKARMDEFLRTHRQPWGRGYDLPSPKTLERQYYRQRGQRSKSQ